MTAWRYSDGAAWRVCNGCSSVCTNSIKSHLEEHNPERVADFMKAAPAAIKRITSDFDNFQVATRFRLVF